MTAVASDRRRRGRLLALFFVVATRTCDAFSYSTMMARSIALQSSTRLHASTSSSSSSLPDIRALQTAPFMKQVEYGTQLASLLVDVSNDDTQQLKQSLQAQLSHSDGIRGFMVAYLSGQDGDDDDKIENVLLEALQDQFRQSDSTEDLVSLMCMNVVMPTAMVTMHEDPSNSANSARTARRGLALLKQVKEESPEFEKNLKAIQKVAQRSSGGESLQQSSDDNALVKTWTDFFDKWGYKEQQAKDIEKAVNDLLA